MEIIDTQVHTNALGPDWGNAAPQVMVERGITAMDAVGVHAVLVDEYTGWDAGGRILPGTVLPNGAMRSTTTYSETAVRMYPGRFAYIGRVDPRDPEADALMKAKRETPGLVALRMVALPNSHDMALFKSGGYDHYFALAEELRFPVFCMIVGHTPAVIEPLVKRHPKLQFILDHCGTWIREPIGTSRGAQLPLVFEMARHPNVALKWSQAPRNVSVQPFPYADAMDHLKDAIAAYGAERVMWGSDTTATQVHHSWAQSLLHILGSERLSESDKQWILAGSARRILDWRAPAQN